MIVCVRVCVLVSICLKLLIYLDFITSRYLGDRGWFCFHVICVWIHHSKDDSSSMQVSVSGFTCYISNIVFPFVFSIVGRIILSFQYFRASNNRNNRSLQHWLQIAPAYNTNWPRWTLDTLDIQTECLYYLYLAKTLFILFTKHMTCFLEC